MLVLVRVVADLRDDSSAGTHATSWYKACITKKSVEERTLATACASADCDVVVGEPWFFSLIWYLVSDKSKETYTTAYFVISRPQTSRLRFPSSSCST